MALYRSNNANPLGGCLPLLMQSPIFIVLFQLLRGLTRRTSTLGHHAAASASAVIPADGSVTLVAPPKLNFNPDYLNSGSQLYRDLKETDEMRSWGLDLAETAGSAISSGFVKGLPYIGLILLVGILGYYQQRQISGRSSNQDQPPQARMMMKVIPIILPVISFGLPAGLVVYYVAQSFIRIGQQAFITRKYYKPAAEEEGEAEGVEAEGGETGASGGQVVSADPNEGRPSGLGERLGISKPPDPYRHGKIRPVSGPPPKPKPKPPAAKGPPPSQKASPEKSQPKKKQKELKERRKKRRRKNEPPPKPTSSRVTPKGAQQRRRKKRRK